jgi:hypothetical protein
VIRAEHSVHTPSDRAKHPRPFEDSPRTLLPQGQTRRVVPREVLHIQTAKVQSTVEEVLTCFFVACRPVT